jgi:thiol-disulfide isomerase/thioredoxin
MLAVLAVALVPQQPAAPATTAPPIAEIRCELAAPPAFEPGLRWSPKGASVPLQRDGDALRGSFHLGHAGSRPIDVRLEQSAAAGHYDVLRLDCDRDGAFGEAERFLATPKEQRGKWWSSFRATVQVPLADGKATRPYPMDLWFVADPQAPDAPPALRWSRRGWCEGQCTVGGAPALVLVTEMNMDGVFDQRDSWAIARDREALLLAPSRSLEGHVWLDGKAYRCAVLDPDGRSIAFAAFDPGITEADEKAKADITAPDRAAARAAAPLAFGKDLAAALATAKQQHKRVFADFQTTWCGPCRTMEQLVYTAKDVVDAAADCVPVALDGDDQRALVARYAVTAYPTMLLLDGDGNELARAVGYRGVAAMTQFLRTAATR